MTLTRAILTIGFAISLAASPGAWQNQPGSKPAPEQPPAPRPEPPGQPINVRVEIAITDQHGTGEPLRKAVTIVAAERARASIRNDAGNRGLLNADVMPSIQPGGAIRLVVGLEYSPSVGAGTESRTLSRINEQVTVMLDHGKPLVISQAADPASDRKVTVQVTATIVK